MEIVNPLGPIGLEDTNGWEIPCSGLVEFSVELAEKSCNVTAWVSPALRDTIIIGSTTLADLGFSGIEDIPGGVIYTDEADAKATPPWEISINNPDRYPGQDATEEIEEGWTREVVYRYNKPYIC